jgi:predicted nucleic acid-binding protein
VRSSSRCDFDTNVLVGALLFSHSTPARAFLAALHAGEILVSADAIAELNDVLGREKFAGCVSGDEDLLSPDSFRGIQILTPDGLLDTLSQDRPEEKWHIAARIAVAEETKEGRQHSTHSSHL